MVLSPRKVAVPLLVGALLALLALAAATPAPAAAASSPCKTWGKTTPDQLRTGHARKAILCLVNKERNARGLPDLDRNRKLQKAAQRHNDRMDGTGCFAHECPGEPALDVRLDDYLTGGLSAWGIGENVAWGSGDYGTPASIVQAWMDSTGHRANILSRDWEEIGVGFSAGSPSSGNSDAGIYTTDFGLRVG
jgi:uncharacterized protein YkwD